MYKDVYKQGRPSPVQLTEGFGNHLSLGLREGLYRAYLSCFVLGGPYEEQCESVAGRPHNSCRQRVMGSVIMYVGLEKQ